MSSGLGFGPLDTESAFYNTLFGIFKVESMITREIEDARAVGLDPSSILEEGGRNLRRWPQFRQRKNILEFTLTIPLIVGCNEFTSCTATLSFQREDYNVRNYPGRLRVGDAIGFY
jgi:hypothetical protein